MKTTGWYNGYDWNERYAKLRVLQRRIKAGDSPPPMGPCQLCNDPAVAAEFHDEDYSQPYLWEPPALYALCRHCHRHKLHKRFSRPHAWRAFLAHVRRGGYARELALPDVKREVASLTRAIAAGEPPFDLRPLRPYPQTPGHEWFADLSCDPLTLNSAVARPRP